MKEKLNIEHKYVLSLEEAAQYFHIGEKKIRRITEDNPGAEFFFMNGNRVMIKRTKFEEFIDHATVI